MMPNVRSLGRLVPLRFSAVASLLRPWRLAHGDPAQCGKSTTESSRALLSFSRVTLPLPPGQEPGSDAEAPEAAIQATVAKSVAKICFWSLFRR